MNSRLNEIRQRYKAGSSVRAAAEELGMRRTDVAAAYREISGGAGRPARLSGAERRAVQMACSARRALGHGVDEIDGYSTDCGVEVGRCYNELSHLPDGTPFLVGGYQTERGREVLGLDGRTEMPGRRDWEGKSPPG